MAEIENSHFCSEKRDIQRSEDVFQPSPSQWNVSAVCQNKSQNSRAVDLKEKRAHKNRKTSGKRNKGNNSKGVKNLPKDICPSFSLPAPHGNIGISPVDKFNKCDFSSKKKGLCNGDSIAHVQENNSETFEVQGQPRGRRREKDKYSERKPPQDVFSVTINPRNGCLRLCRTQAVGHPSVSQDRTDANSQETRITSLRKLLNTPLPSGTSRLPSVSSGDQAGNLSAIHLSNNYTDNANRTVDVPLVAPTSEVSVKRTKNADDETATNAKRSAKSKTCRKRAAKVVGGALNSAEHDEVNEKIAELARTPRIKTLEEIIKSLNIQLDSKPNGSITSLSAHSSVKNNASITKSQGERNTFKEVNAAHKSQSQISRISNLLHSRPPSNETENVNECQKKKLVNQATTNSEEHTPQSSKPVKILISGEVSRKPRNSCQLHNRSPCFNRFCCNVNDEDSILKQNDEYHKERQENCMLEDRENKKDFKKKQGVLARKRQVNSTKELKDILQARTSYRKEICSLRNAHAAEILDTPHKKSRETEQMLPVSQPEVQNYNLNEPASLNQCFSDCYNNANSYAIDDPQESKTPEFTDALLEKYLSSEESCSDQSDLEVSIDKEVSRILSQLPPLDETKICWTESQHVHKVTSVQEIGNLANRIRVEDIEGITGNYSYGEEGETFREWHHTVGMPSYRGSTLVLLPYVVID